MTPARQSTIALGCAILATAGIAGYGQGIGYVLSPSWIAAVVIFSLPLGLLTIATIAGPGTRAANGAGFISWIFLIFEVLLAWNVMTVRGKSTDAIVIGFLILIQLLVALVILIASTVQKAKQSDERGNVT